MEYESRANDWPAKLKKKVRYFVDMVKNTKYEKPVPGLADTRKLLTQALDAKYDPGSVLDWAKEIMCKVEAVRDVLAQVVESSDRKLPHTCAVHSRAKKLVAAISNGIRELNKPLTERE